MIPKTKLTAIVGGTCIDTRLAPSICGMVERCNILMLVDTGSAVTILRTDIWEKLVPSTEHKLSPATQAVVAANGKGLSLSGQVELEIQIGGLKVKHMCLVAKDLTHEFLLGSDFLYTNGCIVDFNTRLLFAGGKMVALKFDQPVTVVCDAVIMENISISENCEMRLMVSLIVDGQRCEDDTPGLLEPEPSFMERHGLAVAHSVAVSREGMIPVQVLNPSNSSIMLRKGEKMGKFVSLGGPHGVCVIEASQKASIPREEVVPSVIEGLVAGVEGLSDTEVEQLRELLYRFSSAISMSDSDMGRTHLVQHHIDTQGANPVKQQPRRLPFYRREEVRQMIADMLGKEVIEPATGPWSSPVILVQKKDGSTRFCIDFRQLNALTKKDAHPLPRIDDTLDMLSGSHWFSTIDLASGYWQVEVAREDQEKTAFSTPFGLFQFRTMPFGLCNAPSTFQRLMERVLSGLHWSTCLVYIDDIIVFSRTVQEHFLDLAGVFQRLKEAGLKVKPKKCHLFRTKVKYLGYVVSSGGVQTDPEKVKCVLDWPVPSTQKELRQFLGLASYYRRFVHNFAQLSAPLNRLLDKSRPWLWTEQCGRAFEALKTKLTSAPLLVYPNFEEEFIVDCDASDDGLGAVLSQNFQGTEHVVCYASRTLTKAERKYCATRKEMLALVWGMGQFRPYLYGRHFTARTDHGALQWLCSFKEPEGQVARWLEYLAEYNFTVEHRPGKKHGNADPLSRHPCHQCGGQPVEVNIIASNQVDAGGWALQWTKQDVVRFQCDDPDIGQMVKWMQHDFPKTCPHTASSTLKSLWSQKLHLVLLDGVLYRSWKDASGNGQNSCLQLVLPKVLVPSILSELHDAPTGGHLGVSKVLDKAHQRFYWVGQRHDIEEWCRSCTVCGAQKSPMKHRRAPMEVDTQTSKPMQRVAMDILGPLPLTPRLNKYILVIGDYFTKWTEAFPMPDMETGTVARLFVNEFVVRYGAPACLHTDQGRNFESNLVKEICRLLGIVKTRTTPYHPQSDGMIERFNRTLLSMLKMASIDDAQDWDLKLPCLMMAYRTSVHETTKATPFSLMFGREVQLPIDVMFGKPPGMSTASTLEYAKVLEQRLAEAYDLVRHNLGVEQHRHKQLYDRKVEGKPYKEGEMVWLYCPAVPRGLSKKLHACWKGPYTITKVYDNGVYQIKWNLPPHKQQVVHFDRLKPYLNRQEEQEPTADQATMSDTERTHDEAEDMYDNMFIQHGHGEEATTDEQHYNNVPVQQEVMGNDQTEGPEENAPVNEGLQEVAEEPTQQQGLRRSTRERRPPERLGTWVMY